jgi:dienelactone hydrolase
MRKAGEREGLDRSYAEFIRKQANGGMRPSAPPATLAVWEERLSLVRAGLKQSFGRAPATTCPLDPEVLGVLMRDGYAIERLTFQSRPGVRVTANLYRPEPVTGRLPAVLSVHGHWSWARIDPHVQSRSIGLAKLGYVVLCVDAFGSGERAIEPGPGTYHGALVGASLWPLGTPLLGLQVYDNRRAVDYLISRPEVDSNQLAITGASGGGNQTLYAGATDERLSAVVPVCGIGTYDAYLSTACCVCEVNVGGAVYASTGDLLALIAPRALLVINATRDAFQFSVGEAAKSIAFARGRFQLMGQERKIKQVAVESGHDYNQQMREAMYGWLDRWLRGRGDGKPIAEPKMTLEDVETLRCYPKGQSRPKTIVTIPEFARAEGQARLAALPKAPDHRERWLADAERLRVSLRDRILGGFPAKVPLEPTRKRQHDAEEVTIATERDFRSRGVFRSALTAKGTAIVLSPGPTAGVEREARHRAEIDRIEREWHEAGFNTLELGNPRGAGETAEVAGVADHTAAEWGLWVGRPLLGQWVWDIVRWLDFVVERPVVVVGLGGMGLPAILAAGLDHRVAGVVCTECLVSFVGRTAGSWKGVPMGLIAPNILDLGDVGQLAGLVAPRPMVIVRGLEPEGNVASSARLGEAFAFTRAVYSLLKAPDKLALGRGSNARVLFGQLPTKDE